MNDSKMLDRAVQALQNELKRQAKSERRSYSAEGEKAYFDGHLDCRALVKATLAASGPETGAVANDRTVDSRTGDLIASLRDLRDQLERVLSEEAAPAPRIALASDVALLQRNNKN